MGDIYCDVAVAATFRGDIQSARKRENKKGKEGNCHHQMVFGQSYNPPSMVVRTNFSVMFCLIFSIFSISNLILLFYVYDIIFYC